MAATADNLAKSIEPASTEYGDRQTLEQGLSAVMGGAGGGQPAAPASTQAPPPVDMGSDPLAGLLDGSLNPGATGSLTDGLSVGPGVTPGEPQEDPKLVRLRDIANTASSPLVRAAARNELRRLVRRPV